MSIRDGRVRRTIGERKVPPIEKPERLMLKLAYYFTRRRFGKVLTPLKVHSARLPSAFGLFYTKISKLDKQLTLPREIVFLIREQVARINICRFCTDIGRWFSIRESIDQAKFDALEEYSTPWRNTAQALCSPMQNGPRWTIRRS